MRLWRPLRWVAIAAAGVCVLAIGGFIRFLIPPSAETGAAPTDAIVVLTGGSARLQSGFDLMREGKGRKLFVSGVNQRVDIAALLHIPGNDAPAWLGCCVAIGHEADNTEENAIETRRWLRRQGYRSLRLVTAWYHMPRSLLEFRRAMPDIEIIPHPVFPAGIKAGNWRAWRGTAALLIGEYAKYMAALFRAIAEPAASANAEFFAAQAQR